MFPLLISFFFLFSILIETTNSICNSSNFFPCACCDEIFYYCVHNSTNPSGHISSYCCIPKELQSSESKQTNITLFNKYCKTNIHLHDPLSSLVNTIISSCDPISKQCYNSKNPITPELLPIPNRLLPSIIVPQSRNKPFVKNVSTSVLTAEKIIKNKPEIDKNKINRQEITNQTIIEFRSASQQSVEEVSLSTVVFPREPSNEDEDDAGQLDEKQHDKRRNGMTGAKETISNNISTNRAVTQLQSILSATLITIINIDVFSIN